MNANPLSLSGRTSDALPREIEARLGSVPAFFAPALCDPSLLAEMWRQALVLSLDNPIPEFFRCQLFAYVSLQCENSYCLVMQCCGLRAAGASGAAILALLCEPPLLPEEALRLAGALAEVAGSIVEWPAPGSHVAQHLFRAAVGLFQAPGVAQSYVAELGRILGPCWFPWLASFLGYIRSCHAWVEAHPEISAQNDACALRHLGPLLDEEPSLAAFLAGHRDRLARERLQREARLAEAEAKYRDLYESALDMHASVEVRTLAIVECNRTLVDTLGYSKEELLGRSVLSLYHADSVAVASHAFRHFLEVGYINDAQLKMVRKSGQPLEVSLHAAPVHSPSGELIGLRAVWRDVSARRQAKRDQHFLLELGEALRRCESAEALLDTATRLLGGYMGASRCWFSEIELRKDLCVVKRDFSDGLPSFVGRYRFSDLSPEVRSDLARGWVVVNRDTQLDHRTAAYFDGRYRPAGIRACVVVPLHRDDVWSAMLWLSTPDPRDWSPRDVGLLQSAAERVWLWLERLRVERKYQRIVEMTREGIWEIDDESNTTFVNPRMAAMLGYSQREMIGRPLFAFMDDEGRQLAARNVERRRQGISESHDFAFRRKDGALLWTRIETDPLFDEQGGYAGALAMVSDATERRAAELALRASLREKEVLLKEIHHRVKNNLQITSSLLSLQAMRLSDPDARRMFEESQARVCSIALVHEALYRSKDLSHVDFCEYVSILVANLSHSLNAAESGVSPVISIAPVWLPVDLAIPCGLIINELVTNCLKHAFRGRASGRFWVRLFARGAGSLCLQVEDDGVGLPAALDPQQSRSLGLDLVFTFAEQLCAEVEVLRAPHTLFQFVFSGGE